MNKNPTNMLTQTQIMDALNRRHSPEKQRLLSEGHVAIAGLGGLGSNVACALARIGVGHLHLIDFDVVDITNLNRQQYFIGQLGMYKTDALKSLLEQINPYLDIRTDCIRVTRENLRELFADAPIVCEAFDDPVAKAMLVNGILEYFPEKKLVSATGMTGADGITPFNFTPEVFTDCAKPLYLRSSTPTMLATSFKSCFSTVTVIPVLISYNV